MKIRARTSLNKVRNNGIPRQHPLLDHDDTWTTKVREHMDGGILSRRFDERMRNRVFDDRIQAMARIAGTAYKLNPFSRSSMFRDHFSDEEAYEVAACVQNYRRTRDGGHESHILAGRKIGFTNTSIWEKYNVTKPNWGYITQSSSSSTRLGAALQRREMVWQPKIEPEIIFFLKSQPRSTMTDREILGCIGAAAYGFEIVTSRFHGWKFTLPDTTAVGALHRSLHIGRTTYAHNWANKEDEFLEQLRTFTIDLSCKPADPTSGWYLFASGSGSNVLGSPIHALRRLCQLLEDQNLHPQLQPGERVSTGTLTDALDIAEDATWTATAKGLDLMAGPGVRMEVKIVDRQRPPATAGTERGTGRQFAAKNEPQGHHGGLDPALKPDVEYTETRDGESFAPLVGDDYPRSR